MYLLTKEDKKVSITQTNTGWSYRKEFGSTIIENFDISNDKLDGMLLELKDFGYKEIKSPLISCYEEDNVKYWVKYSTELGTNLYHREDGPAIEHANGNEYWYKEGKPHREDGPAACFFGDKHWYRDGLKHREDGPAVEFLDGDKHWYRDGRLHREGGPAIEWFDGGREWFKNGERHREDGPAIVSPRGWDEWWLNGKRHRENGPAVNTSLGYKEYWINGERINFVESQYLGVE